MAKKQVTYQFKETTIKKVRTEARRRTKELKRPIAAQVVAEELILKGLKK
jgi:hypothetical protein